MIVQVYKRSDGRWMAHFPDPSKAELDPDGSLDALDPDGSGFDSAGLARQAAKKAVAAMHRLTKTTTFEILDHDPSDDA